MTTVNEVTTRKRVRIEVSYDPDCESPCEWGGWKLYSFSSRHRNNKCFSDFGLCANPDRKSFDRVICKDIGWMSKFKHGVAFFLDCYQHSGIAWSLHGQGMQCQFDTAQYGGILVYEEGAKGLGKTLKTYEQRKKFAADFLNTYNDWANGGVYSYSIEVLDSEVTNDDSSCSGYIGESSLKEAVRDALAIMCRPADYDIVELTGECADLFDISDFKPLKPVVPELPVPTKDDLHNMIVPD